MSISLRVMTVTDWAVSIRGVSDLVAEEARVEALRAWTSSFSTVLACVPAVLVFFRPRARGLFGREVLVSCEDFSTHDE